MCQYYRIFSQLVLASERDITLRRLERTLSQWHTCLSVSVCYTGAGARHRDHPSAPEPPLLPLELSRLNKWTHWHIPLAPDSQPLSLSPWFSPLVTPVPQATFSILQTDQSWQEAGGRHRGRDRAVSGVRVETQTHHLSLNLSPIICSHSAQCRARWREQPELTTDSECRSRSRSWPWVGGWPWPGPAVASESQTHSVWVGATPPRPPSLCLDSLSLGRDSRLQTLQSPASASRGHILLARTFEQLLSDLSHLWASVEPVATD